MKLEDYEVKNVPDRVFYIPDFITQAEESLLMNHVSNAPKPKWTQLSRRRLQNWGGLPHPKGMIAEDLPLWLSTQINNVAALGMFEDGKIPNHVLINEYTPGQGIMPHTDGPLFYPTVTTISCGSHTVLNFYRPKDLENNIDCEIERHPEVSLLLEPRSLVVIQGGMYEKMLHGIEEHTSDVIGPSIANLHLCSGSYTKGQSLERGTRISFTIRHVPKTRKLPGLFQSLLNK